MNMVGQGEAMLEQPTLMEIVEDALDAFSTPPRRITGVKAHILERIATISETAGPGSTAILFTDECPGGEIVRIELIEDDVRK